MNVLLGFEESQTECIEFLKRGHNAFSCDIQQCSGDRPDRHLHMDIFKAIAGGNLTTQSGAKVFIDKWDMIVLHAPCTYTAVCGNRHYFNSPLRAEGVELCKNAWEAANKVCKKVVLEQPKTIMQRFIGPKSQKIQPWQFGHGETKETWLWIRGLPLLEPTNVVSAREQRIWKMPPSKDRGKLRSKSYPGIAKAMAEQWG